MNQEKLGRNSVDSTKNYKCTFTGCGKSYNRVSRLDIHLRTHVKIN